jgi:hypothetical protein
MDIAIRHYADGYSTQFYNIQNRLLNYLNSYPTIILYDLKSADSTSFQLTFTGVDFLPAAGVIVLVERQYLEENAFKTVEAPVTDSKGQTVLHLVKDDVLYNLVFMKNGSVIKIFSDLRAFCDPTVGSCIINLNALSGNQQFDYNTLLGIIYQNPPSYNSSTNIVSFSFTSLDGMEKNLIMTVERSDIFGNISLCSNQISTIGGSISCTIPSGISDTDLIVKITVDGKLWITSPISLNNTSYGSWGYIAWLLIAVASVLMFSNDKNGILLALLFSYMGAAGLGLTLGGLIGAGSAGISIIIFTGIALWKLNKNKTGS